MLFFTKILLAIAVFSVLIFAYALFRLVLIHRRLERRVRSRLSEFQQRVSSLQHRLSLIQSHALDYMNSISPEGARAMYQLQQMVTSQNSLIQELQQWVSSEDTNALKEADQVLTELFTKANLKANSFSGKPETIIHETDCDNLDNWETRSEELLQMVGLDISLASECSRASGIPKRRQRKQTSMSLEEAGIRLVFRNNNPPK